MRPILRNAGLAALLFIAACAPFMMVPAAQQQDVRGAFTIDVFRAWNRVNPQAPGADQGPTENWTIDGPGLDQLLMIVGVAAGLARAAGRHFGRAVTIEKLKRESGGASRQTWSFDAVVDGTSHALILRRDPPTLGAPRPRAEVDRSASIARGTEFRVLRAAFQAGVRAPEVLFELSPDDGLGEGFVMRRIGGIAIARKLLRDAPYDGARKKIAGQLGEILVEAGIMTSEQLDESIRMQAADPRKRLGQLIVEREHGT